MNGRTASARFLVRRSARARIRARTPFPRQTATSRMRSLANCLQIRAPQVTPRTLQLQEALRGVIRDRERAARVEEATRGGEDAQGLRKQQACNRRLLSDRDQVTRPEDLPKERRPPNSHAIQRALLPGRRRGEAIQRRAKKRTDHTQQNEDRTSANQCE